MEEFSYGRITASITLLWIKLKLPLKSYTPSQYIVLIFYAIWLRVFLNFLFKWECLSYIKREPMFIVSPYIATCIYIHLSLQWRYPSPFSWCFQIAFNCIPCNFHYPFIHLFHINSYLLLHSRRGISPGSRDLFLLFQNSLTHNSWHCAFEDGIVKKLW